MPNRTTHDPIDSLIYLDRALPLDWLDERLSEYFADVDGNIPDDSIEADLIAAIVSTREAIREEMRRHRDGRARFSTGVPFERIERYPSTEPDADGNDVPVIATAHVQLHPSGTPTEPVCGGVWADEVAS